MVKKQGKIKSYITRVEGVSKIGIVFASTQGQAKMIAKNLGIFRDYHFCDIRARRIKDFDKYIIKGKMFMNWDDPEDNSILVKELGLER